MNRLLITGALGHIGSRLIRELPRRVPGVAITMADNLSTQRYSSLFDLPAVGHYRFVECDIMTADLDPLVAGCGAVIHLAAITDAASSFSRGDEVDRVNLEGTRRVAVACAAAGVPLLFPSTTSVYGSQAALVDETCPVAELRPQSPYATSKLAAERCLAELGRTHGLRFVTCRLGTIFGTSPGMRFHTAVNKFCWQAVMGQPLTVWRTAYEQKRPYLELGDAVAAMAFILERGLFDGRVYNLVTANATVRQLVDEIRAQVPDLTVAFVESPIMNQLSYEVSGQRFCSAGFSFAGSLAAGIAETVAVLRAAGGRGNAT